MRTCSGIKSFSITALLTHAKHARYTDIVYVLQSTFKSHNIYFTERTGGDRLFNREIKNELYFSVCIDGRSVLLILNIRIRRLPTVSKLPRRFAKFKILTSEECSKLKYHSTLTLFYNPIEDFNKGLWYKFNWKINHYRWQLRGLLHIPAGLLNSRYGMIFT